MSEATDFLNAGEVILDGETAWTLAHVGPGHRAAFAAWLKARARQSLRDLRRAELFRGGEYEESLSLLDRDTAAGAYNWDAPLAGVEAMGGAVRAALAEVPGRLKLLQLLLERDHGPQPPEAVAAALNRQPDAWAAALRRCLGMPDPNARPAGATAATPEAATMHGPPPPTA